MLHTFSTGHLVGMLSSFPGNYLEIASESWICTYTISQDKAKLFLQGTVLFYFPTSQHVVLSNLPLKKQTNKQNNTGLCNWTQAVETCCSRVNFIVINYNLFYIRWNNFCSVRFTSSLTMTIVFGYWRKQGCNYQL